MKYAKIKSDKIPGGRADNKTNKDFDPKQLKMGIKVEMEHTKDSKLANEIARDHLSEIPDYYTRLKKMEEFAKRKFTKEEQAIIDLFKANPNPDDSKIHDLADKLKIDAHKFEGIIYSLLSALL